MTSNINFTDQYSIVLLAMAQHPGKNIKIEESVKLPIPFETGGQLPNIIGIHP